MMKELIVCGTIGMVGSSVAVESGAIIHGFRVDAVDAAADLGGKIVRMTHLKTHAELLWLDRDDDNKTFAIAFKTIPEDDTGVAHIVEHSVLCGSGKYPVKEPFVNLLKTSFATFINAWTAPDYTAYPVCSRNPADFLNLMDVYLDAVFDPVSVKDPRPFMQEGWHWEIDPSSGKPVRNGVVYSEMKGVFADPLQLARVETDRLLFPDNAYGFVSGGDPGAIVSLTFEKYRDFYLKHYHPSNAKVFLDGNIDLDAVLSRLDAAFSRYDCREIDVSIPRQTPHCAAKTIQYALQSGESEESRTILSDAWICSTHEDVERTLALKIIAMALAESNEEPLSKLLIGKGLCEDVSVEVGGCDQITATIIVENAANGHGDEIRRLVSDEIRSLCEKGFDREKLASIMEHEEFAALEKDYGTFPRGLAFFSSVMDQWLYGGDVRKCFEVRSVFASLRKKAAEGWFERLAAEVFLDSPAHASLTMVPDSSLARKRREEEDEETAHLAEKLTEDDFKTMAVLKAYQDSIDSPEAVSTLPRLSLSDIAGKAPVPEYRLVEGAPEGQEVWSVKTSAAGIAYVVLCFPLDSLKGEEFADIAFCAGMYGDLAAGGLSATDVKKALDKDLGRFAVATDVYAESPRDGAPGPAHPSLEVRIAALDGKLDKMMELVPLVVKDSVFRDPERMVPAITQTRRSMELSSGGMSAVRFARKRAAASVSAACAINELMGGYSALRRMQALDEACANDPAAVCDKLDALVKKVVASGASKVFVSSGVSDSWALEFASKFPVQRRMPVRQDPFPAIREGMIVPGDVAAAASAAFMPGSDATGLVAARILSLDYLWREIRVKGGAYGGAFSRSLAGTALFASLNDPNPARSLEIYASAADALSAAAKEDVFGYITGAIAKLEPYMTPSGEMERAVSLQMACKKPELLQKLRDDMLAVTGDDIEEFASLLKAAPFGSSICVAGGEKQIESCSQSLDAVSRAIADKEE